MLPFLIFSNNSLSCEVQLRPLDKLLVYPLHRASKHILTTAQSNQYGKRFCAQIKRKPVNKRFMFQPSYCQTKKTCKCVLFYIEEPPTYTNFCGRSLHQESSFVFSGSYCMVFIFRTIATDRRSQTIAKCAVYL